MNKIKILLLFLTASFCAVSILSVSSSAHTVSIVVEHDPQYTGWDIYDESEAHHSNYTTAITVNKGDFTSADFGNYITNAVTQWNNATFNGTDLLYMKESSTGYIKFCKKTLAQMQKVNKGNAWAFVYRSKATTDSNSHYTLNSGNVEIWVNWDDVLSAKATGCKTHTALHELGHVIGLVDIPASVSPNAYLMCNEFGSYYSVPKEITINDKQGAAVILGQHTNHSFSNSGTWNEKIDNTQHRRICSVCEGYTIQNHSFGAWSDYGQWLQVRFCCCGYAQYRDK